MKVIFIFNGILYFGYTPLCRNYNERGEEHDVTQFYMGNEFNLTLISSGLFTTHELNSTNIAFQTDKYNFDTGFLLSINEDNEIVMYERYMSPKPEHSKIFHRRLGSILRPLTLCCGYNDLIAIQLRTIVHILEGLEYAPLPHAVAEHVAKAMAGVRGFGDNIKIYSIALSDMAESIVDMKTAGTEAELDEIRTRYWTLHRFPKQQKIIAVPYEDIPELSFNAINHHFQGIKE